MNGEVQLVSLFTGPTLHPPPPSPEENHLSCCHLLQFFHPISSFLNCRPIPVFFDEISLHAPIMEFTVSQLSTDGAICLFESSREMVRVLPHNVFLANTVHPCSHQGSKIKCECFAIGEKLASCRRSTRRRTGGGSFAQSVWAQMTYRRMNALDYAQHAFMV